MQENMMNQVKLNFFPTAKISPTHIYAIFYIWQTQYMCSSLYDFTLAESSFI